MLQCSWVGTNYFSVLRKRVEGELKLKLKNWWDSERWKEIQANWKVCSSMPDCCLVGIHDELAFTVQAIFKFQESLSMLTCLHICYILFITEAFGEWRNVLELIIEAFEMQLSLGHHHFIGTKPLLHTGVDAVSDRYHDLVSAQSHVYFESTSEAGLINLWFRCCSGENAAKIYLCRQISLMLSPLHYDWSFFFSSPFPYCEKPVGMRMRELMMLVFTLCHWLVGEKTGQPLTRMATVMHLKDNTRYFREVGR